MWTCRHETVSLASERVWIGLWALERASHKLIVVSALPAIAKKCQSPPRNESPEINDRTRNNHRISLAGELHRLYPAVVPAPSSCRAALLNIPQEDLSVASDARKPCIVGRDGNVKDGVTVRLVSLDRGAGFDCCRGILRIVGNGARQMDGAVRRAREHVRAWVAGKGHRIDGGWRKMLVMFKITRLLHTIVCLQSVKMPGGEFFARHDEVVVEGNSRS